MLRPIASIAFANYLGKLNKNYKPLNKTTTIPTMKRKGEIKINIRVKKMLRIKWISSSKF